MNTTGKRYPSEVKERAVRMLMEHQDEYNSQWAPINSISEKLGVGHETLRRWARQAETDHGVRPGLTTAERETAARTRESHSGT